VLLGACRLGFDELPEGEEIGGIHGPDAGPVGATGAVTVEAGATADSLRDAETSIANPGHNYGPENHMSVATDYSAWIWLALPDVQGTVVSATLTIYTADDNKSDGTVIVKRVTSPWDEDNMTHVTRPSIDPEPLAEFTPIGTSVRYLVPLPTAVVQRWIDDPAQNFGLAIVGGTTTQHVHLRSRESNMWTHLRLELN